MEQDREFDDNFRNLALSICLLMEISVYFFINIR